MNHSRLVTEMTSLLREADETPEAPTVTLPADGKLPTGDVSPEDKRAMLGIFNTKLAKLMQGLKKTAGAKSISQNYKGTGKQAFRRQLWVNFNSGAVIDLWLDNGFIKFGGVVHNTVSGVARPAAMSYAGKTPEDIFDAASKALKPWAG